MKEYPVPPFRPALGLGNPHLQTIGGRFLRRRHGVALRRERIDTPDGDFLDLDFADSEANGWEAPGPASPLAVVLHGLEGSALSGYVLQTLRELGARGIRRVALNFRTCGGEPNRLARFYHSGETGDLAFVLELLAGRFPEAPLGAVGFSLGGNALLKYLGERGEEALARAAVAVSVPFDLAAGAENMERGMGRFYTGRFLRSLWGKYRAKQAVIGDTCDIRRVRAARTFREFDDAATAPLHGFRDAAHYYAESSSARFLSAIRVPTLLLHSADDPFLPADAIPRAAARENPCIVEGFTERGGHVGFVGGTLRSPEFWAEREAARFLAFRLPRG
ncbi:MAG TPA: hydrolase [Longimicrobiaceae bacterium]|nr:hydrolase [Longimicrobiaceae bacterium]